MKCLLVFLFSLNAYSSTGPADCGIYDVYGRLEKSKKNPGENQYVINGGSVSEYKFDLTSEQEIKLVPYFERPSKIRATISKKVQNFEGELSEISKVSDAIPDPAGLTPGKGFILIKQEKCK